MKNVNISITFSIFTAKILTIVQEIPAKIAGLVLMESLVIRVHVYLVSPGSTARQVRFDYINIHYLFNRLPLVELIKNISKRFTFGILLHLHFYLLIRHQRMRF